MEKQQIIVTIVSVIASFLLFTTSIVWIIGRTIRKKKVPEKYNKAGVSAALIFSILTLISIWLLKFAVGYADIVTSVGDKSEQLTPLEEIANSLFGALRTFTLEEEYSAYVKGIKSLVSEIVPATHWSFPVVKIATIVHASILNLIAPIISGAIILEIIASIFPKIGLRWSYLFVKRPKYFFSELNPASLSLAKSIYNKEKSEKPILIFTDTYVDDEKEKEYELLLEAKKYGAICIRDDLAHVKKTGCGKRAYFLMDENEFGNLQTLMGLTENYNVKYIRDAYIYLFVQSDAYVQLEKQINKEFEKEEKKKLLKGKEKPTIVPVNGYRNLVQNLFVDVPLYEPLINKKGSTELNITILGNGIIGTEAFLNAYWLGQMMVRSDVDGEKSMSECKMTINVVSKDEENVFWSKIDYVNPEIKGTVEVLENCTDNSENELLCYDSHGNKNNPYCHVKYIQADVKVGGFWDGDSKKTQQLLDSDYFIVALGNDADNISVGDKLRRLVGKKHIEEADEIVGQVIIAYAVFNSKLANTLNNQTHNQCRKKGRTDIYTYAFGSLEEVYSYDNIYMSKTKLLAEGTGSAYDQAQIKQKHIEDHKQRSNNNDKNYAHWADLARAMHIKYKAFSLGLMRKSIFDLTPENYKKYVKERCNLYKKLVSYNAISRFEDVLVEWDAFEANKHMLAWLEHRRWIAFTRTMGYQFTKEFKKNLDLNGENHKNMELKLHPCLVEAAKPSKNKPRYDNDALKALFVDLPDQFKIVCSKGYFEKNPIKDLLNRKKDHLSKRVELFKNHSTGGYDKLDETTFNWCKKATEVSIDMIDETLVTLGSLEERSRLTEELEKTLKKAWEGISCYDFKKYDYCQHDYDDYFTDKELSEKLGVKPARIVKLCENKKFKGAEYIEERSEWHIPLRAVRDKIKKLYRELNSKPDQKLIDEGKAVDIFGVWYQKRKS